MVSVGLAANNMEVATKLTGKYNFKLVVGDSTRILNKEFMEEEFPNGIDFYHVDGGHDGPVPFLDLHACLDYLNDERIGFEIENNYYGCIERRSTNS